MSQSDDSVSYNVWNNCEFWNSRILNDCDRSCSWNFGCKTNASGNFSKSNSSVSAVSSGYGESPDDPSLDSLTPLPSWAPIGSVLYDADTPSIWSTSELYPSNHQDLSLSAPSIPWQPPLTSTSGVFGPNICSEVWDSALDSVPSTTVDAKSNSWGDGQIPKQRDSLISGGSDLSASTHSCAFTDSGVSTIVSTKSKVFPPSCLSTTSSSSLVAGTASKIPGRYTDGPIASPAFSTEQLCDHLINSNEGWGRRPVDQIVTWETVDPSTPADSLEHSGFTTPTPGSRAPSGSASVCRPLQSHHVESNVWTNEPPTGTGIWELNCEGCVVRRSTWNPPLTSLPNDTACDLSSRSNDPSTLLNSIDSIVADRGSSLHPLPIRSTGTNRSWDSNDKFWSSPSGTSTVGRPLLGGACSGPTVTLDELTGWYQDSQALSMGSADAEGNFPWEYLGTDTSTLPWNSSTSTGAPPFQSVMLVGTDAIPRQQTSSASNLSRPTAEKRLVHPFSNTYRADLVKFLMSQGFSKEDVQAALIDCNMEPERALHELRERCHFHPTGCQHPNGNALSQFPPTNSFVTPGPHMPPNCANSSPGLGLVTSVRGTLSVTAGTNNPPNQLSLGSHPNQQLMRQQITQQLRSALNLSLPNSLAGSLGSNQLSSVTSGNSLLGQPPPPLLCGSGVPPIAGLNLSIPGSTYLSPQFRNPANSTSRFSSNFTSAPKRSDRQMSIIASIQDLHKKHQSIQQQMNVYRNNAAMCSQPQYADVFTELQGQMHQIEAQLRAKQVQLNMAYAQDYVTPTRGQSLANISDRSQNDGNGIISNGPAPHGRTVNQDQLVQQLMDLRVRSTASTNTDINDSTFPVVGTWTPYTKNSHEASDKLLDRAASRLHTTGRPVVSKANHFSNFGGTWQPNVSRVAQCSTTHNWRANGPSRLLDGSVFPNNPETTPVSSGTDLQLCQSTGQWLLVQPLNINSLPLNLTVLHHLLSPFGLTQFRVLNAATGCVLIHLQSNEFAIQLIRSLGDRFSIEAISDPDLLARMQQRTQSFTNNFNLTTEPGAALLGNGFGAHWLGPDHHSLSNNSIYAQKKASTHTNRLGVMVSGIH